jgi:hypothetical protein
MATPADQRLLELLDKWLKSLELHAKYSSLDDDTYWKIQPWVEHQRPSRWIIDLAMQKAVALRTHVEERIKMGDARYADSLELMIFLANLVGSDHIERFIPLAEAEKERTMPAAPADSTLATSASGATATREMPKFAALKRPPPAAGTAHIARTERKAAAPAKPAARAANKQAARPGPTVKKLAPRGGTGVASDRDGSSEVARAQVIADAARLVQWGRKWYELPELIARMADRPPLPEVRRILKENKSAIDEKAGASSR